MEIYFSSLTISSRLFLQDCFLSNDPTMHQRYVFSSSKVRPKKTVNRERERKKRELWIHRRRLIFPGRHPERNLFSLRIFGEEEFSSDSVTCSTLCEGMNNCVSGSDFYFYLLFFNFFFFFFFVRKVVRISLVCFFGFEGSNFGIFAGLWASWVSVAKIWSPDWVQMWERESFSSKLYDLLRKYFEKIKKTW